MHPFFRYGHNSSPHGHGAQSRKDSMPRNRSPSGSCEEDDYEPVTGGKPPPSPRTSSKKCESPSKKSPSTVKMVPPNVPIIKVENEIVMTSHGSKSSDRSRSGENRKRLGPNKNNIILETLQNELQGGK